MTSAANEMYSEKQNPHMVLLAMPLATAFEQFPLPDTDEVKSVTSAAKETCSDWSPFVAERTDSQSVAVELSHSDVTRSTPR